MKLLRVLWGLLLVLWQPVWLLGLLLRYLPLWQKVLPLERLLSPTLVTTSLNGELSLPSFCGTRTPVYRRYASVKSYANQLV
jgi:hypothetical protein